MVEVVVIGAGSAGLGTGYHLQRKGIDFVILERGRIGEAWRTQRWDSFALNTPNRISGLPGSPYDGDDPDGFLPRDAVVQSFEQHATRHGLPIRPGTAVVGVSVDDGGFLVQAVGPDGPGTVAARAVVVASGGQASPKIPPIASNIPDHVLQMHSADYRSPDALPDGAVVVVGSGQSGCQIVEDLLAAGRTVYLSTSRVARVPRRYRGRDILVWLRDIGMMDQTVPDLEDPMMRFAAQPLVSGVGPRGRTVSLQALQRAGARLMGRVSGVSNGRLVGDDGLAEHIAFGDGFSAQIKTAIDGFIAATGADCPPPDDDPADLPAGPEVAAAGIGSVDLSEVGAVIWSTGFTGDYGWLGVAPLDGRGQPIHDRGVSPTPGIYFVGMPWQHTRKSGIIFGIDEDAAHVVAAVADFLG